MRRWREWIASRTDGGNAARLSESRAPDAARAVPERAVSCGTASAIAASTVVNFAAGSRVPARCAPIGAEMASSASVTRGWTRRIRNILRISEDFRGINPRRAIGGEPAGEGADGGEDDGGANQRQRIARLEAVQERRDELRRPHAHAGADGDPDRDEQRHTR